jgi:hypothetical protein
MSTCLILSSVPTDDELDAARNWQSSDSIVWHILLSKVSKSVAGLIAVVKRTGSSRDIYNALHL